MASRTLRPLKKYAFKVVLAPLLKLIEVATELLMPFLTRYIIDKGIANSDMAYTLKLGGLMLGMAVLGFFITMLAQYLSAKVSSEYGYDLRKDLYAHLNTLSEKQLDEFGKQKVLTLVNNDSFSMQSGVNMFMRLVLRPPFLLLGSTILSFVIDYRAGLIFAAAIILSSLVIALVMVVSPKKYAAIQGQLDQISTLASDSLKGARPIRAFNKQDYENKKFNGAVDNYLDKNMAMARYNALINPLTFCFINLAVAGVVYLGQITFSAGGITTGELISLIQYLVSSLTALIMFSRMIVSLNKAAASKKRIDAFFAYQPSIVNKALYRGDKDPASDVLFSFQDVSLVYGKEGDKPAVSDLSFTIKKGSFVGIIGGTGSGKSSTIALMERLYEPAKGSITYRGYPLDDYDLDSLRQEIALVSQKPSLFKGTIRSNLLLGKKDATDEEMTQAIKDSLAYDYISQYPDYLDHPIEEGGANLSGGQKQRLLIARALLKGGSLIILDDSTSALDYLSDEKVRSNLSARKQLTKIMISQRASSLAHCDLILVYDNGKIVAQGSHEELLKSCAIYRDIYEMQRAQA
jgi:ATP-binding cassette subfamily B multidrug efflux pump